MQRKEESPCKDQGCYKERWVMFKMDMTFTIKLPLVYKGEDSVLPFTCIDGGLNSVTNP